MITIRLAELLKQHNLSVYRLHQIIQKQAEEKNEKTKSKKDKDKGLSRKALYALTWNQPKQIDIETLNKICNAVGVKSVTELIEYIPDEQTNNE